MSGILLRPLSSIISVVLALSVAVLMPFGHLLVGYMNAADTLAFKADLNAGRVAKYIYSHGELWHYQRGRVVELIELPGAALRQRVYDDKNRLQVDDGAVPAFPTMTRAAPIVVSGSVAGRIEVETSLQPLLRNSGLFAVLGLFLGSSIYLASRFYPLSVLRRTRKELELQNRQLMQQETELRTQNLRFDAALNNMTQGLVMYDAVQRLVVCNERFIQMHGLSREAMKPGRPLREVIALRKSVGHVAINIEQYIDEVLATLAERKNHVRDVEYDDGRTIRVVNRPMAGGGWVATHEDITERRAAERELRHTKTFLHTIVENVPAPIIVKDPRNLCYVLVNRATEKLFGIPRERIIGKNSHDLFPTQEADAIVARDEELLRSTGRRARFGKALPHAWSR